MRTRLFPALHREVSVLTLGTQAFGTSITLEESFRILDYYVSIGGNFLDTARLYGYYAENVQGVSEYVIGQWMKTRKNRNDIIIGTKGAHPELGHMDKGRLDRQSILSDLEKSLKALETDHVDIYWLHRDDAGRPVEDILETLQTIVRQGKALAVGASNWTVDRLEASLKAAGKMGFEGFGAVQPQWSLARQEVLEDKTLVRMDEEEYAWHLENGLPVVPFTSQAKGFYYKLAAGGIDSLSAKARERFLSERNLRTYGLLKEISERTGNGIGALSIAYLTSQPFPVYPIVGFSSLLQAQSMEEAGSIMLGKEDLELLNDSCGIDRFA